MNLLAGPENLIDSPKRREQAVRLALGYQNGDLEVLSIRFDAHTDELIATPIYTGLCWDKESPSRLAWRREMLFAGTLEGRVLFYDNVDPPKQRKSKRVQ